MQYVFEVRIDDTIVDKYAVNDSLIKELKNVKVVARSTSFYQYANVRIRNLFYKSGRPGKTSKINLKETKKYLVNKLLLRIPIWSNVSQKMSLSISIKSDRGYHHWKSYIANDRLVFK